MKPPSRRAVLVVAALAAAGLPGGCRTAPPEAAQAAGAKGRVTPARVELKQVPDRPTISLVSRLGDPQPAVAVAVAHDLGSRASVHLAAMLQARLARSGFRHATSRASHLGFNLRSLVAGPPQAAGFVRAVTQALASPIAANATELPAVGEQLQAPTAASPRGSAEAAVAECAGELGAGLRDGPAKADSAVTVAELERWRNRVYSARAVAFAALGPQPVVDSATKALESTPAWPKHAGPQDRWPTRDVVGVASCAQPERRLSLALRVAEGTAAIEAVQQLVRPGAALRARLASLQPPWKLTRAAATTRPRGACLRLDLEAPGADAAPPASRVADVTLVALQEASVALEVGSDSGWTLEQSVLRAADPREAAAVAAWRALSGQLRPGPLRRFVSYAGRLAGEDPGQALSRALRKGERSWTRATLERRARVEPGQGQLWALLACPCGTSGETAQDAGEAALFVRSVSLLAPQRDGVSIEPWITADGVGLLAHAPPDSPHEHPTDHARRVGSALGRALIDGQLGGQHFAQARHDLLAAVGPGPRPGRWLALDAVAPDRPSWLEPRGRWSTLTEITTQAVARRRRQFVRGPLRLAVLANWSKQQVSAVTEGLQRWLRPLRSRQADCIPVTRPRPRPGRYALQTSPGEDNPAAYVAVPLVAASPAARRAAEWTLLLLNRPDGWLEHALSMADPAASAHASLLGGKHAAALLIEVYTEPQAAEQAVAQVRGLLQRLARGAARAEDAALASRYFQNLDRRVALEPRHRVAKVWRASASEPSADLVSLRKLHRRSLQSERHIVVLVRAQQ